MRWLSFYRDSEDAKGPLAYKNATFGYVVRDGEAQEGVVDAGKRSQFETLKQAIEENALDTIVESCGQSPDFALGEITYAPTITQPNKFSVLVSITKLTKRKQVGAEKVCQPYLLGLRPHRLGIIKKCYDRRNLEL